MTNYIEQLMKAAGVEPEKRFKECKENAKDTGLCTKYPCIKCESSVFTDKYPVFMPEKQLELEKLLMDKIGYIKIFHIPEIPAKMPESYTYNIFGGKFEFNSKNYTGETRPQALALLVIKAIEFNELEKSEVKRILEDD